MDRNSVTNTFNTLVQIKLSAKLSAKLSVKLSVKFTVKFTVINSFKTSVQQRLSSTPILDNASKR
jgi:hypothetical protein